MSAVTKTLIPNQEWIVKDNDRKIGSIYKKKRGYDFIRKGQKLEFKNLEQVKTDLGITIIEGGQSKKSIALDENQHVIYDFPCGSKPFNPLYNIKKKLPLFAKSLKSQSLYCAGYYVIKFRKGWVKSFCPKLITLERYPYYGPFKTECEMKNMLNFLNKS
ncbi:MAG: hypothetical protein EBU90_04675 [Proteobacteria bacterium]|nr:hypothetical protein [Pseudomonadota bacterium]NBP13735.1 hypothetical protein [bacterium]